ncbi:glycosyl hydrolase family 16 [Flavobacteriaceae bacterium MAR_2010_72]|nr:glycosyl hydrolase family 16 [Flavobacteriaceae bacterium MAR_2010_72]
MLKKLFFITLIICVSCSSGGDDPITPNPLPQEIIPTNLVLNVEVIGADANNPNGDGSGTIRCTASAVNAVKYGFRFGTGSEIESATGNIDFSYTEAGTRSYTVYVFAYSSTGHSINTYKEITVYVQGSTSQAVWADEFDTNGSPDASKWTYDIGAGGWGNGESQYYTNRPDNVTVSNGVLKIIAKKESYEGAQYTSARLKSQGKFDFKYGRIEVRAKLPAAAGTWPAIWMLGANFTTVGWPRCGEIDIMEQTGTDKSKVLGTCHWLNTSNSTTASYGLDKTVTDATTQFHVYSMEWTSSAIKIFVDDVQYYVIDIRNSAIPDSPFHSNFFMILNVALGGSLGGTIPGNFTESVMEIDYVRVYQN